MTSPGGTGTLHGGPPGAVTGPLPGYPQDTHSDVPVKVERITAASTGKSKRTDTEPNVFSSLLFINNNFFSFQKKERNLQIVI